MGKHFNSKYDKIISENQETLTEAADLEKLKQEEKEVRGLIANMEEAVDGLYKAQKQLSYHSRNTKALPHSKGKQVKKIGGLWKSTDKLYESLSDYVDTLNDHFDDVQEMIIDLEEKQ